MTHLLAVLLSCAPAAEKPDPCAGADALAACGSPKLSPEAYVATAQAYFDTMDRRVEAPPWPPYSERVARWEWPPWLKLTAYTRDNIHATDTALRAYPSVVTDRECRAFETQPFARCRVVFRYDDRPDSPCPIYEEFLFNDAGEVTWIEAWSDLPGLGPVDLEADPWAEGSAASRLSSRIPGLGSPTGWIDPAGEAMGEAAARDPDVADFVRRAEDWAGTWAEEHEAVGESMWEVGCGGQARR
jgi:hypothetical protein